MPKFTISEFIEKTSALTKLAYPEKGAMDIYTAHKLADFLDEAKKHLARIEKSRHELYELHGDKDDAGNITIRKDEAKAFQSAWEEFLGGEVVLPNVKEIPLSKLAKLDLTPVDITQLKFLILAEDEPVK